MFDLFRSLRGRGSIGALIAFVLVLLASWTPLHAFGPEPHSTQSEIVYLMVLIVAATFGIGAAIGGREHIDQDRVASNSETKVLGPAPAI